MPFEAQPCPECNDLEFTGYGSSKWIRGDRLTASSNGCCFCRVLREALELCFPDFSLCDIHSIEADALGCFHVSVEFGFRQYLELYTLAGEPSPIAFKLPDMYSMQSGAPRIAQCPQGTTLPGHLASEESVSRALGWLSHCKETHVSCSIQSPKRVPTRVLDLSLRPGPENEVGDIRLYVPGKEERLDYVCLSHCWGTARSFHLTTLGSLSASLRGINLIALPKTFQDAIDMTRRLGYRFLWIDSLCIVQDSVDDWARESANMASIYQNAVLTLAATRATGDEVGFLGLAQSYPTHKIVLETREALRQICARRRVPHIIPIEGEHIEEMPLLKRGWVYQERMLSRRILHFGKSELSWECLEDTACECKHVGTLTNGYETSHRTPKQHHQKFINQPKNSGLGHRWHQVVKEYSQLSLTYGQDIFPALSGMAKQMQQRSNDVYLAGLWKATLLDDLCWYNVSSVKEKRRVWRAPTWSWASVDGAVEFSTFGLSEKGRASVLDCHCVPVGADTTGQLRSVFLILHTKVISMQLDSAMSSHSSDEPGIIRKDGPFSTLYMDILLSSDMQHFYCILIGRIGNKSYALIAIKLQGEENIYERIGIGVVKPDSDTGKQGIGDLFNVGDSTVKLV